MDLACGLFDHFRLEFAWRGLGGVLNVVAGICALIAGILFLI